MTSTEPIGFAHFLAATDAVGAGLFVVLVAMSVASWYVIIAKTAQRLAAGRRSQRFLAAFWSAPSLSAVERRLAEHYPDEAFSHLAHQAITAARHHEQHGTASLADGGTRSEFLTRAIRRTIDEDTARFEWGLTTLASIGSTAPFVGLFGTVWGVYHALVGIGMSGQGTLDKVAGPVGEALLMTGAGLAVAIPAVLAYNAFVRSNRLVLARLDAFAHDVFAVLTTGAHVGRDEQGAPRRPAVVAATTTLAPTGGR
jgi:biopolymer transport protein ExbB